MEAVGTVMSVAQTLFAALQCSQLQEFMSTFGYESKLEDLQGTVSTIKAMFRDAEAKQNLSEVDKKLIEKLKDAVYDADDLLDEFVTLIEQKKLLKADGSISEKMQRFLSRTNPFVVAFRMSKRVKEIKKRFDAITYNKQFRFEHDPEPIRKRRPETCSYVDVSEIIGREEDLEKIVGMLLDPDVGRDVSFLSIVGIGGLGKTTLAQLVYNDPRITSAFPVRKWACVSDDQKELNVKEVLTKIVNSPNHEGSIDQVQSQLGEELAHNKYLIVLDDVWTENCYQWRELEKYLIGGHRGSSVIVTARSHQTAMIIRDVQLYELEGLSEENSWRLFQRASFGSDEFDPPQDLVAIGRGIVAKCARSPLAIRVVGSLLYGQDKKKWQSVHEIGLSSIRASENGIMPILKLSYYHLEPPLKSCFSYCAMFPKDFEIEKEMLISLWMAQGFVVPLDEGQSIEDAGEEYFSILMRRCFFQYVPEHRLLKNVRVKIHDLMHDIAQNVSRKEIYVTSTTSDNLDKKVRHLSINAYNYEKHSLGKTLIRSYIHVGYMSSRGEHVKTLIANCKFLRALDWSGLKMKCLPDSIGTLLHLRYLDLSANENLEVLPKTIAKLCNLQTLKLAECYNLKELPKNLCKLVKLRTLDIFECDNLKYMPRGMDKLTCLYLLSDFIVGSEESCSSWKQWVDGLEELKALKNLKGELSITFRWPENVENVLEEYGRKKRLYLVDKENLNKLDIYFSVKEAHKRMNDEGTIALMEDLQPHPNLKILSIVFYHGTMMPYWLFVLPNLVELKLRQCNELKGWRVGDDHLHQLHQDASNNVSKAQSHLLPKLPQLKSLIIVNCPELTWIPLCPKLENLTLMDFNERLALGEVCPASAMPSGSCKEVSNSCHKLKYINLDNVAWLKSLPIEAFQCLEHLRICFDEEVENFGEIREVFRRCSSSLRRLEIIRCPELRSIVEGGLEHLNALESLEITDCDNLRFSEEKEGNNLMPHSSLLPSLRHLRFENLPQLVNLPNWMQFLPALQSLCIWKCSKLNAMPNWMPKLTTLSQLTIWQCSKSLKSRCQKDPPGEDWPSIQHIPGIRVHGFM